MTTIDRARVGACYGYKIECKCCAEKQHVGFSFSSVRVAEERARTEQEACRKKYDDEQNEARMKLRGVA